jgi:hypothetical protein
MEAQRLRPPGTGLGTVEAAGGVGPAERRAGEQQERNERSFVSVALIVTTVRAIVKG